MSALRISELRISEQIRLVFAVWLSVVCTVAVGCKDLASTDNPPALNSLASETPKSDDTSPGTADLSDGQAKLSPVAPVRPSGTTGPASANAGTPDTTAPNEDPGPAAPQAIPAARKESIALPAATPDEIYEPKVVLSQAHGKTCLVNVGDQLPDLALQSLAGEPVSLKALRGDGLTVVVFWTNRLAFSREQVARLTEEVALPFRHLGVKVIAVNVGDPVEQIELDAETREAVTCVLDPDRSAIAKVATSKLPRTYLLDGDGRILWFDIEYSRTTRRQLKNAIFFHSRDASAPS